MEDLRTFYILHINMLTNKGLYKGKGMSIFLQHSEIKRVVEALI